MKKTAMLLLSLALVLCLSLIHISGLSPCSSEKNS